jgi:hypothetical protein
MFYDKNIAKTLPLDHQPKTYWDKSNTGCIGHAYYRLIGCLSTNFSDKSPFFEILTTTSTSTNTSRCYPFKISIFPNKQAIDVRKVTLQAFQSSKVDVASQIYSNNNLITPQNFISTETRSIGPKAKRLLNGLNFLNSQEMKSQRPGAGNCWLKQAKRCVLANLFIEILTKRQEMSISQVWKYSNKLYSNWKKHTLLLIKEINEGSEVTPQLKVIAQRKIEQKLAKA